VEVLKRYAPHLPSVKVDPGQIKQVFVNVILNAVQAMPLGGKVVLETGLSGAYVKIAVQDTGVGISSEDLQKVFDPFYTTKEVGVGTGLGLSLSYSIIQNHQGMINLISKIGQGTTVTILLPLSEWGQV
jgi:two-component system NtrC family sensor kinase